MIDWPMRVVVARHEGRILLVQRRQALAELVEVGLRLRLQRTVGVRRRELRRRQRHLALAANTACCRCGCCAASPPRRCRRHAANPPARGAIRSPGRVARAARLSPVAVLTRSRPGLHVAAVDPEVGNQADVRLVHRLEHQQPPSPCRRARPRRSRRWRHSPRTFARSTGEEPYLATKSSIRDTPDVGRRRHGEHRDKQSLLHRLVQVRHGSLPR